MKIVWSAKMAECSGGFTQELVVLNTTKFSHQSNWLMKCSKECMELLESTRKITETIIAHRQKYYYKRVAKLNRKRSYHVSNVSKNQELTKDSPNQPFKTKVNISQGQRVPGRFNWFRKNLRQVALKTLLQSCMCCPDTCLPNQQQVKKLKQKPESNPTSWPNMPRTGDNHFQQGISVRFSSDK